MLRRKAIPTNDGLPIVKGKKVKRRQKYNPYHEGTSSSLFPYIWKIAVIAFLLYVTLKNNEKGSEETSTNVVTKTETVSASNNAPPARQAGNGFPAKCNEQQKAKLLKQLPLDRTRYGASRPWRDASFTLATVRSGGPFNPQLVREFYASDDFSLNPNHVFFGVSIGWNQNDIPIDMLRVGSQNVRSFDTRAWNTAISLNAAKALPPINIASKGNVRQAKYLVVETSPTNEDIITKARNKLQISEDTMVVKKSNSLLDLKTTLDRNRPAVNGKIADDQPIHFLDIYRLDETDAMVLKNLSNDLEKVRFVHFQYNKGRYWNNNKLSDIIALFERQGHVCYFAGQKGPDYDLWRITGCFLDHFDQNHWAGISCVNVQKDDVKLLAERMEAKFLKTLEKDQSFPVLR